MMNLVIAQNIKVVTNSFSRDTLLVQELIIGINHT
jgi:hypothetical protein